MWDLIVLIPDHCLSIYFGNKAYRVAPTINIAKKLRVKETK